MKCHDCNKEETFEEYETPFGTFYKCEECFKKDSLLRNYRPTEVYSRIVGYYRATNSWNEGAKTQYKARKAYKV